MSWNERIIDLLSYELTFNYSDPINHFTTALITLFWCMSQQTEKSYLHFYGYFAMLQ